MFPAAHYVDKIAKGASLSSWVNLKAIKALGIALPQPLLIRADRVLE
jgi:hypothetical protein